MLAIYHKLRGSIEGPRWARSDIAIKRAAFELGLECKVERMTTLLDEVVQFEILGDKDKVVGFQGLLKSAVKEWNKD